MVYSDFSQNILRRLCQMSTTFKWVLDVIGNLSFCLNWIFFFLYRMFKTGCDSISMRKYKNKTQRLKQTQRQKKTNSITPQCTSRCHNPSKEQRRQEPHLELQHVLRWFVWFKRIIIHSFKLNTLTIFPTMTILQHIEYHKIYLDITNILKYNI